MMEVKNLAQVKAALETFSKKDALEISAKSTIRAAGFMRGRVRLLVPRSEGTLRKSITAKRKINRRTGEYSVVIYSKIGYYATLLYGYREASKRASRPHCQTVSELV